jgi:hypothetical protein
MYRARVPQLWVGRARFRFQAAFCDLEAVYRRLGADYFLRSQKMEHSSISSRCRYRFARW